ncbi:MAG: four helix bundle protein [Bacteroidota bacterium]
MHNLRQLKIWATSKFPNEEAYGLKSQIRRSAMSIPSNIAEGAGRKSDKEFLYFLGISNGSSYELQTQLIISNNVGLLSEEDMNPILSQLTEIQKMNYTFQEKLKK